jgi:hypothetical protein
MRVMVIVRANESIEAGGLPDAATIAEMGRFNDALAKAGVLLAVEGLHPSAKGVRVRYGKGRQTVTDGPFAEAKELVGGFWLWQVRSMAEAVEWARRAPFEDGAEVEIRRVFEADEITS